GAVPAGGNGLGGHREGAEVRVRGHGGGRPGRAPRQDPARRAPRLLRCHRHPGPGGRARDRAPPPGPPLHGRGRPGRGRGGLPLPHRGARMSRRILVLEGITERGLAVLRDEGWEIDQKPALPPAELAAIVAPYEAMTIRSSSRITSEVLDAAKSLRVIGRPGVGVDNVDLEAATRRGIVVMNSPLGNLVSTAELPMPLLLSLPRNIPAADASMKAGKWDRKSFAGVELNGKRIGVVGFGRIGREVAARCRALGMEVVAYDPFVSAGTAEALHVALLGLPELLQSCDFVTLHTTLGKDTRHLIGKKALESAKPGLRIINAARGELIDDEALLAALDSGRVA